MSVVQTLIGNIKGPQGSQGIQGETGAAGAAASVTVGSTTTTAYGNAASVTNSGTSSAAVLDFVIPQGKPGEATTKMGDLLLDAITSSAADFPSPQVGDTGKTAFGKITKFFSDVLAKFTQHEGDIATISTSPTTRSFNKGDYLVYEGTLYKVTANIANGGTLTVGTNITATSAGGELTSLNDSLVNATAPTEITATAGTGVTINAQRVYKIGRIAICEFDITTSSSLATNSDILTGCPSAIATWEFFGEKTADGSTHAFYVTSSGYIRTSGALPAGTWIADAVYVTYS